jgi:membrane protease YdiL (CAAX protease family)
MQHEGMGRRQIVRLAVLCEGGLAVLACLLSWSAGLPPWAKLAWDPHAAVLGVAASVPMLALLAVCALTPWRPLARIRQFVDQVVRPLFRDCTVADLALIALLAGLGEELFFRGLLQEALAGWLGPWPALAVVSLLFGLMHPMTAAYAVLAFLAGAYLGWAYLASENLLVPILAHALYDFTALVYILRTPGATDAADTAPGQPNEVPARPTE